MGDIPHLPTRPTETRRPTGRRGQPVAATPWPWGIGWVGPGISAPQERSISISNSVLDQVIPMVYGTATVTGNIAAWKYNETTKQLSLGVVFCYGEVGSITLVTTYLNGERISLITGVGSYSVHPGDGTTALSSVLTGMSGWTAADTTLWKNYAHLACTIDCRTSQVPGSFTFTSKIVGRKCTPIGGGAAAVTENPVGIAYDIMTSSEWAGVSTAKIDDTSWGVVADWCDEVMGDASARYEFNGIVKTRDPDAAVKEVLGHALAHPYINTDGKVALWCEMAPPAITGDWSATASTTITEDATSGNAVAELSADDWVYVGTNLRQVDSVTDDDTVVLKTAVTVSGVKVRPISNVVIRKRDWVDPPNASEVSLLQTPDQYRVRFVDEDNAGSHQVTASYGAGTDKIVEATLNGCASASVAARHAETMLKIAHTQPYFWSGSVGNNVGTALEPGDVLLFSDDVLSSQAARVLPPIRANPDGTYDLTLREYDPSAYSDSTDVTDTVPSLGDGYSAANPPVVTQINTVYSNTEYGLIGIGSSGISAGRVTVGDEDRDTVLNSGDVRLPNGVPLYGLTDAGAPVGLLEMNGSNQIELGDPAHPIYFNGTEFIMKNNAPLQGELSGGGSWTDLLKVDGTDRVRVGESGRTMYLDSDDLYVTDYPAVFRLKNSGGIYPAALQYTATGLLIGDSSYLTRLQGVRIDVENDIRFTMGDANCEFQGLLQGTGAAPTTTNLPNDGDFCIWEQTTGPTFTWQINDGGTIRQIS